MSQQGFLSGCFLAAMPDMRDDRFHRSVIYICTHSPEGAMGFILNHPHPGNFLDLVVQLELDDENEPRQKDAPIFSQPVRYGGPVDPGCGFVLHSADYNSVTTTAVAQDVCLTSTIDILRLLSRGEGPERALVVLGYAGWAPGQLEHEIHANSWLIAPANTGMLFDLHIETLYERILASIGIDLGRFVSDAGHS